MNTKHTPGEWHTSKTINDFSIYSDKETSKDIALVFQYSRSIPEEEAKANAELIAAAPELLQMVYDLKQAVKRLSQDDLTQFDRDREAQIEGEAHELLYKINPDYYNNANT